MKFLTDINMPQSVITTLITESYDVLDLKRKKLDLKDTEVIQLAKQENRIILTRDKDFLALTQFPKYQIPTIVIRLKIQLPSHITEHLVQVIKNQDENILTKSLTIIREDSASSHPY